MKFYIMSYRFLYVALLTSGTLIYATDPTFHFKNNSSGEIQYELLQGQKSITGGVKLLHKGKSGKFNVDISKPTTIHLYYCLTPESCKTTAPVAGKVHKTKVTFPANKTIYIKFDGKNITPQKGVKGKNSEGYNTDNNVTSDEITEIKGQVPKDRTL